MTKTYAEQQEDGRRLSEASQNARVSFDMANHGLKAALRERSTFDAMLKDHDFQRWIREMWEAEKGALPNRAVTEAQPEDLALAHIARCTASNGSHLCEKFEGHAFECRFTRPVPRPTEPAAREAQLEREKADTYENVPAPPGTMPKQEPLKCAWCRRNPAIASFSRAGTASPICAECVWPASRGKPVLGNPPAWLDEPDDYVPQPTRAEAERMMSDLSGVNSVCRGTPPEETKPPARAHLKGCVLDTDHKEVCYVPFARDTHGATPAPEPKSPALSPRQALGEALACVERAQSLIGGMLAAEAPNSVHAHAVRAGVLLIDVQPELRRAYEAAK